MAEAAAKGVAVWSEQEFIDAISGKKAGGKKKAASDASSAPVAKKAKVASSPSKIAASTVVTSTR